MLLKKHVAGRKLHIINCPTHVKRFLPYQVFSQLCKISADLLVEKLLSLTENLLWLETEEESY